MRVLALLCNPASLAFTLLVFLTDGISAEASYRVFTVLLIVVPCVSLAILLRWPEGPIPSAALITSLLSVGLLAGIGWALVDQYPHPSEAGFLSYVVLMMATPIVTILAVLSTKPWARRGRQRAFRHA